MQNQTDICIYILKGIKSIIYCYYLKLITDLKSFDSRLINCFKLYVLSNVSHLVIAWRLYNGLYNTRLCSVEIELVAGTVESNFPDSIYTQCLGQRKMINSAIDCATMKVNRYTCYSYIFCGYVKFQSFLV